MALLFVIGVRAAGMANRTSSVPCTWGRRVGAEDHRLPGVVIHGEADGDILGQAARGLLGYGAVVQPLLVGEARRQDTLARPLAAAPLDQPKTAGVVHIRTSIRPH